MKLSFVIPAFNEEHYIGQCLRSILSEQKNVDCEVEIIVVNNASTDSTKDVALSFPSVRVVDEPRKGLTYARQAGFLASTGQLVANIDADVIVPSGWVSTVLRQFKAKPRLVALSGPLIYHDLPITPNILIRIYYYAGYLAYLVNRFALRVGSLLQGGNFVVRREALEKAGGFNTSFSFYGEDTEVAGRLQKIGPVVFSFGLPMYSSGRRLKEEGFVKMGWKYPINYFWTSFFKKPFNVKFVDIRPQLNMPSLQTTTQKLHHAMAGIGLGLASFLLVASVIGLYISAQLSKLAQPTVAEAKQSDSFMVRKFGPEVIRVRQKIYEIKTDSDDK